MSHLLIFSNLSAVIFLFIVILLLFNMILLEALNKKVVTSRVRSDIVNSLKMQFPHVTIGSFDRQNLFYSVKSFDRGKAFLNELVAEISTCVDKADSTIIYCTTVKDVEEVISLFSNVIYLIFLFCMHMCRGNSS